MQISNYGIGNYAGYIYARDQAKFEKTPAVKEAAQKTAKAALSDEVVAQIREHAKKAPRSMFTCRTIMSR